MSFLANYPLWPFQGRGGDAACGSGNCFIPPVHPMLVCNPSPSLGKTSKNKSTSFRNHDDKIPSSKPALPRALAILKNISMRANLCQYQHFLTCKPRGISSPVSSQ